MKADVRWERVRNTSCLFFRFEEVFTEDDARASIEQAHAVLQGGGDGVTMVWDCRNMRRYDTGAREVWQGFIRSLKPRIREIHLVSDNLMIRMGATTIGLFAGIRVQAWKCLTEIPFGGA